MTLYQKIANAEAKALKVYAVLIDKCEKAAQDGQMYYDVPHKYSMNLMEIDALQLEFERNGYEILSPPGGTDCQFIISWEHAKGKEASRMRQDALDIRKFRKDTMTRFSTCCDLSRKYDENPFIFAFTWKERYGVPWFIDKCRDEKLCRIKQLADYRLKIFLEK